MSALAEMYVQGVSTRKVKAVTETLCGHSFSASSVSEMNKTLDAALTAFATRRLDEPYPYLILDARYERAREGGAIASHRIAIRRRQARQRRAAVARRKAGCDNSTPMASRFDPILKRRLRRLNKALCSTAQRRQPALAIRTTSPLRR